MSVQLPFHAWCKPNLHDSMAPAFIVGARVQQICSAHIGIFHLQGHVADDALFDARRGDKLKQLVQLGIVQLSGQRCRYSLRGDTRGSPSCLSSQPDLFLHGLLWRLVLGVPTDSALALNELRLQG